MAYGLQSISPPVRLVLVISVTSGLLFVNDLRLLLLSVVVAFALFCSVPRRPWRLFVVLVLPTAVFYFVGNILFSPPAARSHGVSIFRVNEEGFALGAMGAMRMSAILLTSLAWLASTPLPELYASVSWVPLIGGWAIGIVRGLQLVTREFTLIAQSLAIRGLRLHTMWRLVLRGDWRLVRHNIVVYLALLRVILIRQLLRTSKAVLSWQSHHVTLRSGMQGLSLEARDINVRYGSSKPLVVKDVSVLVEPGQLLYIIGRSGSGKTSLLRVLAGLIPRLMGQVAGTVSVGGRLLTSLTFDDLTAQIRFVDQDIESAILGLTVAQEMLMIEPDAVRSRRCLEELGIAHLWPRQTTKLSGGEQIRLILAGLIAGKQPIAILDDPLDQLDAPGRMAFEEGLLGYLTGEGRTVVVSDRHFETFSRHATAIASMSNGGLSLHAGEWQPTADQYAHFGVSDASAFTPLPFRAARTTPIAALQGVHVTLSDTAILTGVSLEVMAGECIAIQGDNGSGKTTAVLTLAGIYEPLEGSVTRPDHVGMLFQDPSFQVVAPDAYNEIALTANLRGMPQAEIHQHASSLLSRLGIDAKESPLDLHPQSLKLLALASMSVGAELLILDEPTVGLDNVGIEKVLELIGDCLIKGVGVVVITHELWLARMCDRIIHLVGGRLAPANGRS